LSAVIIIRKSAAQILIFFTSTKLMLTLTQQFHFDNDKHHNKQYIHPRPTQCFSSPFNDPLTVILRCWIQLLAKEVNVGVTAHVGAAGDMLVLHRKGYPSFRWWKIWRWHLGMWRLRMWRLSLGHSVPMWTLGSFWYHLADLASSLRTWVLAVWAWRFKPSILRWASGWAWLDELVSMTWHFNAIVGFFVSRLGVSTWAWGFRLGLAFYLHLCVSIWFPQWCLAWEKGKSLIVAFLLLPNLSNFANTVCWLFDNWNY